MSQTTPNKVVVTGKKTTVSVSVSAAPTLTVNQPAKTSGTIQVKGASGNAPKTVVTQNNQTVNVQAQSVNMLSVSAGTPVTAVVSAVGAMGQRGPTGAPGPDGE